MKKFKKVYIEITNKCNLNCSFCSKVKRKQENISLEKFEHILKQLNRYTDYIYLHVKGEPLLHPDFKKLLVISKKYNKQVNITTNGSLLKYRVSDIINSKVVRQINISMQSLTNDKYLNDILESVSLILKSTNIQIVLRFWALENNTFSKVEETTINKIIDFFKLDLCIYNDIKNKNNIKLLNRLYLNKEKLFEWPNLNNKFYCERSTCYGLRNQLAILVDGTVVPCCLDSDGIINLGNIFNTNFDDIIGQERVKNIIDNFQNNKISEELCKHCSYRTRFKK